MIPEQCKAQFLSDFPEVVRRDLVSMVGRAYPRSWSDVEEEHCSTTAQDLYPHVRRANIEEGLLEVAAKYPGQIVVRPTANKRDSAHFNRLIAGQSILTQSKTNCPNDLPRDADFRLTYARTPQLALALFPEPDDIPPEEANGLYGVLVHGPSDNDRTQLAFIGVQFPDPTGKHVLAYVDLFPLWDEAHVPAAFPAVPIPAAEPRLKIVARSTQEESGA